MNAPGMASPCIGVCAVNPEAGRCIGCLRTLEEIACWAQYSEAERRAIMAELERRRAADAGAADPGRTPGRTDHEPND